MSSWDLGICIPPAIAGASGYLKCNQSRISNLCIVTDKACYKDETSDLSLATSSKLQSLSVAGMQSRDLISILELCPPSTTRLKHLTIDLSFWFINGAMLNRVFRRNPNKVVEVLLSLQKNGTTAWFASLQSLCLSFTSLQGLSYDLAHSLSAGTLTSLKLWNCADSLTLLDQLKDFGQALQLTTFEIVLDEVSIIESLTFKCEEVMRDFLLSVGGLKTIAISTLLYGFMQLATICKGITKHKQTLKQMVLHNRAIDPREGIHRAFDIASDWSAELRRLSGELTLEFLGVCTDCETAVSAEPKSF